jgi:hypothetical protein
VTNSTNNKSKSNRGALRGEEREERLHIRWAFLDFLSVFICGMDRGEFDV